VPQRAAWFSNPRPAARHDAGPVDNAWIMLDGRLFFVVGSTPGGAPYGSFEDEIELCDDAPF